MNWLVLNIPDHVSRNDFIGVQTLIERTESEGWSLFAVDQGVLYFRKSA